MVKRNAKLSVLAAGLMLILALSGCSLLDYPTLEPIQLSPTATLVPPTDTPEPTETLPALTSAPETQAEVPTNTPLSLPQPSFPDPAGYTWELVAGGFVRPLGLTNAGDGSGRIFVVEQAGRIRILLDGEILPQPFLDIRERVGDEYNEQGLLGLAFHPDFAENGYFYVNYTDLQGDTVIARFNFSAEDPNLADPESEVQLITLDQPWINHNGGGLAFGPDGYLYISLGDGGSGGDPRGHAQSLDFLFGKLLRIDVDGGDPYGIPPDNPFIDAGGHPEIWAYGLRNPWRITFDRLTGDLFIGDVGQNTWEEVNHLPADHPGGANFGWNWFEGFEIYDRSHLPPDDFTSVEPLAVYDHTNGCAVTGGYVYRGEELPAFQGIYFYADYCTAQIFGLLRNADGQWESRSLFNLTILLPSFGEDESGELYLVDLQGTIYRLTAR